MKKNRLAIFDFDGTVSKTDSTKFFLRSSFGKIYFLYGYYFRFIHLYILSQIGIYDFVKLKEKRISFFLKDISSKKLDTLIKRFNNDFFNQYLRSDALKRLDWHKKNNHKIIILSATIMQLISEWSSSNNYTLIANSLTFYDDISSGNFDRPDCSFSEKVFRLKEEVNLEDFEHIYGYGDTESDLDFLNVVDEPYFQYFKK